MQVITLTKAKELLGITGTTQDAAITAKLGIIDAKVKLISQNNFNYQFGGDTTLDSNIISVYALADNYNDNFVYKNGDWYNKQTSGIMNPYIYSDISENLSPGQLISGDGIPADSYINEITKNGTTLNITGLDYYVTYITISANCTATETGVIITGGISIGYQDVIAKGIQHLINQTNSKVSDSTWTSRSIGGVSVSRGTADVSMENKYGMPAWFVKGLPRYQRGF